MNIVDSTITEIVSIERVNTPTVCGFKFTIKVNCWGSESVKIVWGTTFNEYELGDLFRE